MSRFISKNKNLRIKNDCKEEHITLNLTFKAETVTFAGRRNSLRYIQQLAAVHSSDDDENVTNTIARNLEVSIYL